MIWAIYILSVFTKKGFAISWQHTEFLFCEQINQLLFLLKTIFYVSICILFYVSIYILFYVSICILFYVSICILLETWMVSYVKWRVEHPGLVEWLEMWRGSTMPEDSLLTETLSVPVGVASGLGLLLSLYFLILCVCGKR